MIGFSAPAIHQPFTTIPVLKPDIIAELEKHRDQELAERKEKRKKQAEEEAAKKAKGGDGEKAEQKDDHDNTIKWSSPRQSASTPTEVLRLFRVCFVLL